MALWIKLFLCSQLILFYIYDNTVAAGHFGNDPGYFRCAIHYGARQGIIGLFGSRGESIYRRNMNTGTVMMHLQPVNRDSRFRKKTC